MIVNNLHKENCLACEPFLFVSLYPKDLFVLCCYLQCWSYVSGSKVIFPQVPKDGLFCFLNHLKFISDAQLDLTPKINSEFMSDVTLCPVIHSREA